MTINVDPQDNTRAQVHQMLGGLGRVPDDARVTTPFTIVYPMPRTGSVVAIENPISKDCLVSASAHVITANGSALSVDVGIDNTAPHSTSDDDLLDGASLNATGVPGKGTNGGADRYLAAGGAVVVDLSGNAAAALVANLAVTYTPL